MWSPAAFTLVVRLPTRSLLGPASTLFQFQWYEPRKLHQPSWCFDVRTTSVENFKRYVLYTAYKQCSVYCSWVMQHLHWAPAFLKMLAHWSGSNISALNIGAKSAYLMHGCKEKSHKKVYFLKSSQQHLKHSDLILHSNSWIFIVKIFLSCAKNENSYTIFIITARYIHGTHSMWTKHCYIKIPHTKILQMGIMVLCNSAHLNSSPVQGYLSSITPEHPYTRLWNSTMSFSPSSNLFQYHAVLKPGTLKEYKSIYIISMTTSYCYYCISFSRRVVQLPEKSPVHCI